MFYIVFKIGVASQSRVTLLLFLLETFLPTPLYSSKFTKNSIDSCICHFLVFRRSLHFKSGWQGSTDLTATLSKIIKVCCIYFGGNAADDSLRL